MRNSHQTQHLPSTSIHLPQSLIPPHRQKDSTATPKLVTLSFQLTKNSLPLKLEIPHPSIRKGFQDFKESLEYSQEQIILQITTEENKQLKNSFTHNLTSFAKENRQMKETILDLQAQSLHDNLNFPVINHTPYKLHLSSANNYIHTWGGTLMGFLSGLLRRSLPHGTWSRWFCY